MDSSSVAGWLFAIGPMNTETRSHFSWIIDSFKVDNGSQYVSSDFGFGKDKRNVWSLRITINDSEDLSLGLSSTDPAKSPRKECFVHASVKKHNENSDTRISLYLCMTAVRITGERYHELFKGVHCREGKDLWLSNFECDFENEYDSANLRNDQVGPGVLVVNFSLELLIPMNHSLSTSDNFKVLLANQHLSDAAIVIGRKVVPIHKAILVARSPVFLAMLENNVVKKNTTHMKVQDLNHKSTLKLLEYIYTDKIQDFEDCAESLMKAAEKYRLKRLKTLCVYELRESLSLDNVVKTLILADLCESSDLKREALDFIVWQKASIENMTNMDLLERSYPYLLREILTVLAKT